MSTIKTDTTSLRAFLEHLASIVEADFSIILWNGEVVPMRQNPGSDLALKIFDPGVITSLLRKPRSSTLIMMLVHGRIRIVNGTLLDLEPRRAVVEGKLRNGGLKRIRKGLAFRALWPYFFGNKDATVESVDFTGKITDSTEKGRDDKEMVQFHYDLSNEFYALFLDDKMVYSCAYFPHWEASLEEAQTSKLDMTCRKLRLQPGERFLDIGCGWGGLVIHAAQNYGVHAHGVTLSQAQYDFAQERIAKLGLENQVTIELKDFRELRGTYDKIASVGMFEHVGIDNHDAYFAQMNSLLRVRGLLLNHAIVRRAKRRDFRRKPPEYEAVTRYIFPGGELDHIGMTLDNLEMHDFDVHDVEGWREHYQLTCRLWTERLYARRVEAEAMIGEVKTHLWLLYLARSAIAFERGGAALFQTLASKRAPGPSGLPPTRQDLYR